MSYKKRNLIIVSVFIIVVSLFIGFVNIFYFPRKLNKASETNQNLEQQIAALNHIEEEYIQLTELISKKEMSFAELDKQVVSQITSAETYQYLNQILGYIGFIEFNMLYRTTEQMEGYGFHTFNLRGEAPFYKIYRFIWFIENGPHIYKIKKISLRGVESKDPETGELQLIVPFEMELESYFSDITDLPKIKRTLSSVQVKKANNIFYPYILRNLPPNSDNLIEIERAELKAIIPDKVLIADFEGKIHSLREGDAVYLGYLTKINSEKNAAEFTLNKGGVYEKFILKLRFEEPDI